MIAVLMGPSPVGVPDLLQQPGRMRAEGTRQVEGGGQQRLQDGVADWRGLVLPGSVRHRGDDRGSGSSPGPQVRGDCVGGEQFPVGDQVGDGLGGSPAGCRAALAGHVPVLVEQVAAVGHPCLAPVVVDAGEAGGVLGGQPVQEPGQLGEPGERGRQVQRGPVGVRQDDHGLVPGGEHGHDLLLGDQPPAVTDDRGEVEPAVDPGHLVGKPGDLGEIPHVVVEHGPCRAAGEGEPGLAADVSVGERGLAGAGGAGQCGCHLVSSSGRRGISSSRPLMLAAARVTTAGSKRSSTWTTRWE